MSIAELFIRRPVMTTLVMIAILLFGIVAYRQLPVSDLPNVDFPTIQVNANLPGASPETMASAVAMPLEKQFSTIPGLDSMTSTSQLGNTQVTLQFTLDRNIDAAAQDVQAMIAKAARDLPPDMPTPPSYQKVNPADQPVLYLNVASDTMRLSDVDEYAETLIAQRISMVPGVAQVNVFGGAKYAVRAQLDPRKMASAQIGINEVVNAIQNGNVNLPTGILWGPNQAYTVQATGQINTAEAYRPLIVAYRNGAPVRLEQIGHVFDSVENDKSASWMVDQRTIILPIQKQPGTNTIEVVDNIKNLFPTFQAQLPPTVKLGIRSDRSIAIRESVRDVKYTLMLTIALVIMVIFLFLRNISATVIPSLALPMSIVGTFAAMYLLGYSVDNLSLMALTLSVGFVVDDAIVMLENIVRHMEMGEPPFQAALRGSREIGFTILSMTLSLAAVFIPVVFMGGILGRLLHEFAVTIGVAILVSGFVSLTLTPMACSRFLRPPHDQRHGAIYNLVEKAFDSTLHLYDRTLKVAMAHRRTVMAISLIILVATVYLGFKMPTGFLPSEDTSQIVCFTEAAQGISFDDMVAHQKALATIVKNDPELKDWIVDYFSTVPRGSANQGMLFFRLIDDRSKRPHVDQIIQKLRTKLSVVPGIMVFPQNPPPIRIGGQLTKSQYQLTLQSPDTDELYRYAPVMLERMRKLPGLLDVTSDLQLKNPQVNVKIDRDKASAVGLTPQQIEDSLYSAYGSRQISTIYAPNNAYKVVVEVEPQFQRDPNALGLLYIRSNSGQLIPLSSVAKIERNVGPLTVNHMGQSPSVTLSFNLRPDFPLGTAVEEIYKTARETLPSTIATNFQGAAQAFQSSMVGLGVLLVMSILVIYIILGILYESFIHPITILSGLPSAGFGALLTLYVFSRPWMPQFIRSTNELNLYAFVGIIMLIGIVKKNAIMMIDFALDAQRNSGQKPEEAIYYGCLVRFRPIMMTTMAALMGTLPIALGWGAGSESRRPLGLAVVGGLVFSQLITLYLTPVFYIYMEQFQQFMARTFKKGKKAPEEALEPALASHD
jgi:hydrophobic/amphiphilic exporter-1 (mainly G- bacteria), HAE1 family